MVSVFASGLLSSVVTAVIIGLVCPVMRKKFGAKVSKNSTSVHAPIYDVVKMSEMKETVQLTSNVAYASANI